MHFSQMKTSGGYKLEEVVSALQKSIRRGLERDAVFWAMQLEEKYWKYLWRRLVIIAHEDIGPASPMIPVLVETARKHYVEWRTERNQPEPIFLVNTIISMCRAPKSRDADELYILVYGDPNLHLDVPDYALDMFTSAGRAARRNTAHFYESSALVSPDASDHRYTEKAKQLDVSGARYPDWLNPDSKPSPKSKSPKQTSLFGK